MYGQEDGFRFLRGLGRRTSACIALSVTRQPLEFVVAARIAEHDFMSSAREDRSELAAHQSRTENADSHAAPLSIDQLLQVFRVPFPLHRDLSRRVVDLVEFVGRKFDGTASHVLFDTMQLLCTRDGPNPRLLRNHPVK